MRRRAGPFSIVFLARAFGINIVPAAHAVGHARILATTRRPRVTPIVELAFASNLLCGPGVLYVNFEYSLE
ncbi:MAG: hypothetical protein WBX25_10505 [Rhodomicrobium sp.]